LYGAIYATNQTECEYHDNAGALQGLNPMPQFTTRAAPRPHPAHTENPMSVSLAQALDIITEQARPGRVNSLPPAITHGFVAAGDMTAQCDVPESPRCARDGFAIASAQAEKASFFKPVGFAPSHTVLAETANPGSIASGSAARVFTGAPVPEGADCVVPNEDATMRKGKLMVTTPPRPGEHLRAPGSDLSRGTLLLRAGELISPTVMAAAVRSRVQEVDVFERPSTLILALGSELADPEDVVADDTGFPADNPVLLRALLREHGAGTSMYHVVQDTMMDILHELENPEARLVITTGGTGGSERDLAARAAEEAGFSMLFKGVDMRPGHNCFLGERDGTLLFGLPGPPPAVLACWRMLVLPALRLMRGLDEPDKPVPATLAKGYSVPAGPSRIIPCSLKLRRSRLMATPLDDPGTPVMQSMMQTGGFIAAPPGITANKGDEIEILMLRPRLFS
jgi:molybdopterin molybdotransferase